MRVYWCGGGLAIGIGLASVRRRPGRNDLSQEAHPDPRAASTANETPGRQPDRGFFVDNRHSFHSDMGDWKMSIATFAYRVYYDGYRGEGYWRFSVARPGQAATAGRALPGGLRHLRSLARKRLP